MLLLYYIWLFKGEEREKKPEKVCGVIMAEKFPNCVKILT
jgi:hypothetical protein